MSLILLLAFLVVSPGLARASIDSTNVVLQEILNSLRDQALALEGPLGTNSTIYLQESSRPARIVLRSPQFFRLPASAEARLTQLSLVNRTEVKGAFRSRTLGTLRFSIQALDDNPLRTGDVRLALARLCPTLRAGSLPLGIQANRVSRLAHLRDCNHLPSLELRESFDSLAEARRVGYAPCSICFPASATIDLPDYKFERYLGLATRAHLLSLSAELETHPLLWRLREAGQRVLARWPFLRRGYTYAFGVIDSDVPNAFSCPTGFVYVTAGLLSSIESETELEALLAHEIAHCERRHGYQQFKATLSAEATIGFLLGLFGVGFGGDAQPGFDMVSDFVIAAGRIGAALASTGHSVQNELEADTYAALYMKHAGYPNGLTALEGVLAKFQFAETQHGRPPSGGASFLSHPWLESRIRLCRRIVTELYPAGTVFDGFDREDNLICSLTLSAWAVVPTEPVGAAARAYDPSLPTPLPTFETRVFGHLEVEGELAVPVKVSSMSLTADAGTLALDNFEDTLVLPGSFSGISFHLKSAKPIEPRDPRSIAMAVPKVVTWRQRGR